MITQFEQGLRQAVFTHVEQRLRKAEEQLRKAEEQLRRAERQFQQAKADYRAQFLTAA